MTFIEELKQLPSLQIRPSSRGVEYLEAVVITRDIGAVEQVLIRHLGEPHKVPGQEFLFDDEIKEIVDAAGGVMMDQTLFYRRDGELILYAMLWPWQSDPTKITLKSGIVRTGNV